MRAEEIKRIIKPQDVAYRYLGVPNKRGNKLWYKAPWRDERTASLLVDDRGFYDFGESWGGDIFAFTQKYFRVDFKTAYAMICRDFNITTDDNFSNESTRHTIELRKQETEIKNRLREWFDEIWNKLCEELHIVQKAIPYLRGDALAIYYDKEFKIELLIEQLENIKTTEEIAQTYKNKDLIEEVLL